MWTYRCSPVAALGQDPSHSLSGWVVAGFWFRSPADHPRAEAGCKNPFPGHIPLSRPEPVDVNARNSMCIFSHFLLALSLPPLQKSGSCGVDCLDLWEQGFLCSIYSHSES